MNSGILRRRHLQASGRGLPDRVQRRLAGLLTAPRGLGRLRV